MAKVPFIEVQGESYKNEFGEAPIQITAEVKADNLVFTIYGKDYGIYDVNFFVNHADCFEFNGSELLDERPIFAASKMNSRGLFKGENCKADGKQVDEFGNEEVRVLFNEDFWKKCYMDEDLEKVVSFVLKAENIIFK